MERLIPEAMGEWYGGGVYPGGVGSGESYRGTTILPRHLSDPTDSPKLRFLEPQEARKLAKQLLDKRLEQYGDVGEVYSAGQKVLDGISAEGLVPLRIQRQGPSLAFELDFLDALGSRRTISGLIIAQGGPKSWKLVGTLRLVRPVDPLADL